MTKLEIRQGSMNPESALVNVKEKEIPRIRARGERVPRSSPTPLSAGHESQRQTRREIVGENFQRYPGDSTFPFAFSMRRPTRQAQATRPTRRVCTPTLDSLFSLALAQSFFWPRFRETRKVAVRFPFYLRSCI